LALAIRKKDYEKLTDANISHVISLLSTDEPITKKAACEILNIRYNTTRLQRIIDDFEDTLAHKERRKSQNKGKGATRAEIKEVIELYLNGDNISSIAKILYRSNAFVRGIIERVGIPRKLPKGFSKTKDILLPDECVAEAFEEGERVWAARENAPATIIREHNPAYQANMAGMQEFDYEKEYGSKGYQIYVYEEFRGNEDFHYAYGHLVKGQAGHYSFSLAYDLGSLRHLEKYGVSF
jgi:transposase